MFVHDTDEVHKPYATTFVSSRYSINLGHHGKTVAYRGNRSLDFHAGLASTHSM
jgi:hypothetical protein